MPSRKGKGKDKEKEKATSAEQSSQPAENIKKIGKVVPIT